MGRADQTGFPKIPSGFLPGISEHAIFVYYHNIFHHGMQYHQSDAVCCTQKTGSGGNMAEELQIEKDLVEDLLARLTGKGKKGREAAIEALAMSTEDADWRPDELIKQGGIEIIRDLLGEKNTHIVLSALEIIIAIAAAGHEEELANDGVIASLDSMQNSRNSAIREKVEEALVLLQPEPEELKAPIPDDDDYLP
jgi:hypothetical protein